MPPLSAAHRALVNQFMAATNTTDRVAQKYLKGANYNLQVAADAFFTTGGSGSAGASASAQAKQEAQLNKMFDEIRGDSGSDKNVAEAEAIQAYIESLGVNTEGAEMFVPMYIIQVEGFGKMTREGFVKGWKATGAPATKTAQKSYIRDAIGLFRTDLTYLKKVYRFAFIAGKEAEQKALQLDVALVFWDMFFDKNVFNWRSQKIEWLPHWKTFLEEKWTRSVNKDMWNQTLEFAIKSREDDTLSFWSEDAAWPGVIDSFVQWCNEKGVLKPDEDMNEDED